MIFRSPRRRVRAGRPEARPATTLASALLLSACASTDVPTTAAPTTAATIDPPAAAEVAPLRLSFAAAKKAIIRDRERLWRDASSIKGARITAPHYCPTRPAEACVCVESNARNAYGGYTGVTTTLFVFAGDTIADAIGNLLPTAQAKCGTFVPFPELNAR